MLGLAREGYGHFAIDARDALATVRFPGFWRLLKKQRRAAIDEVRASFDRRRYLEQCRKYCPALELADLEPHPAGIRAQAVRRDGTLLHDFVFAGSERVLHVLNAPSPAATAALPTAQMIAARTLGEAASY